MSAAPKMPAGPERKSDWWRGASLILGYLIFVEFFLFAFPGLGMLGPLWVVFVLFVVLAMSWEYGGRWLRGEIKPPKAEDDWPIRREDLPQAQAGSNYVLVQTHPPTGKSPKVKELTPGQNFSRLVFYWAPIKFGDAILSLAYQQFGKATGRPPEKQVSTSSAFDQ